MRSKRMSRVLSSVFVIILLPFAVGLFMSVNSDPGEENVGFSWIQHSFAAEGFSGGTGASEDPYLISNLNDLLALSNSENAAFWNSHFKQTADIDALSGPALPIGNRVDPFTGSYDGQGYSIHNISINQPGENSIGLFGRAENATIKNLTIHGVVTGMKEVGGLVGHLSGDNSIIENVHTDVTVTATKDLDNEWTEAGGLVGTMLGGTIHQCSAQGDVTGPGRTIGGLVGFVRSSKITASYASGNVSTTSINQGSVGGLVGTMDNGRGLADLPLIEDCYATGNVSAGVNTGTPGVGGLVGRVRSVDSHINRSYAMGTVSTDGGETGGLVGYNADTTHSNITNSFWDTDSSVINTSAGGTGKTTADMQKESVFSGDGWQFPNVWRIDETDTNPANGGYPSLAWQGMRYYVAATDGIDASLLAYWSFDDDFSADIGGQDYYFIGDGNGSSPEQGQFAGRNAVSFQRSDEQYLLTANPYRKILETGNSFTYMAWYYLKDEIVGDRYFVVETNVSHPLSYGLRTDGSIAKGQVFTYGGSFFIDNGAEGYGASPGKWHNIIVTYDAGSKNHTAYINGQAGGEMTEEITLDLEGLVVGSYRDHNGRYWEGYIDEAAIWNRVLTETEIANLQTTQLFGEEAYIRDIVTYDGNGNTGGEVPIDSSVYEEGVQVTVLGNTGGLEKTDYMFAGWNTESNGSGTYYEVGNELGRPSEVITLFAQWDAISYDITYNLNGGTNHESNPADYTIETETVTLDSATKEGYTFAGWFDAASGGTEITQIENGSTDNIELWARWTLNTDTIYQVAHYQQNVTGDTYTLSDTDNLSGTTDTTVTAEAKSYTGFTENTEHGDYVESGTISADGSLVLKLYYDRILHNVTFDSNEGSTVDSATGIRYGAVISAPAEPAREGYIFLGWYKEEALTNQWHFSTDNVLDDVTLYAKWADVSEIWMTTTPSKVMGNVVFNETFTLEVYNDTVTSYVYNETGDISLGGVFEDLVVDRVVTTGETTVMVEISGNLEKEGTGTLSLHESRLGISDTPLTAEVTVNLSIHRVSFNSNGGSAVTDQSVTYGGYATEPANPSRTGYSFQGWYQDSGFTQPWDFITDPVREDVTLHARWHSVSSGSDQEGNDTGTPSPEPEPESEPDQDLEPEPEPESEISCVEVIINGEGFCAGNETVIDLDGQRVVLLVIDSLQMLEHIENVSRDQQGLNEVIMQVGNSGDAAKVRFAGDVAKKLEEKNFEVSVKVEDVEYRLKAMDLGIDQVMDLMEIDEAELSSVEIEISISKVDDGEIFQALKNLEAAGRQLVTEAVRFNITARRTDGQGEITEVNITRFSNYVDRIFQMPGDLDPNQITTGVVFHGDGMVSHVPTTVFENGDVWYASIHSLSNSVYGVVWNPVEVDAVEGHWSERVVNEMSARLLLETDHYEPDMAISRGELATYMVKALGLFGEKIDTLETAGLFEDVAANHPERKGIILASQWGLINGYPDGTFKPDRNITREEAMALYSRAMNLVQLEEEVGNMKMFRDGQEVSEWAREGVQQVLQAEIFVGRGNGLMALKESLTYSEALVSIRKLLVRAELINPS